MKFLIWLIRILLFLIFLAIAAANTQEATLNFVSGVTWHAPLILIGLAFFVTGLLAGWLFALPAYFSRKLEIRRLKRALKQAKEVKETPPMEEPPRLL